MYVPFPTLVFMWAMKYDPHWLQVAFKSISSWMTLSMDINWKVAEWLPQWHHMSMLIGTKITSAVAIYSFDLASIQILQPMKRPMIILTASDLDCAFLMIKWKIIQIHGAMQMEGQPKQPKQRNVIGGVRSIWVISVTGWSHMDKLLCGFHKFSFCPCFHPSIMHWMASCMSDNRGSMEFLE